MLGKLEEFFGKHKKLVIIGFVICMAVFAGINGYKHIADSKIEKIDYTRFRAMLDKGEITEIEYSQNKEYMTVVASHGSRYKTLHPRYEEFRKEMLEHGVNLKAHADLAATELMVIILELVIVSVWFVVIIYSQWNTGKLRAGDIVKKSDVHFTDVIGLDEIMDDINLYVSMIKEPKIGRKIGARAPKGLLLAGEPGTGKTLIAKAMACEAGVPFISISGSEFAELFKGVGAKRVRQVFKIARRHTPCIVFFDEIDAMGGSRSSIKADSEDVQIINQLLKEMDGFTPTEGIFVLAATNCPDKLDRALKRSGRFDRQIIVNPPRDWKVRKQMLEFYLKDYKVAEDLEITSLAKAISGFTGADISMICNEASLIAITKEKSRIDMECIEEAIDKKVFKGSRSKNKQHEKDREIVAYHEAGHAVMKYLCGEPISRVSTIGTTSGVGGAVFGQEGESQFVTRDKLEHDVMACYAGQISENIKFGSVTTGASNDLTQATKLLKGYVASYGFDTKIGPVDLMYLKEEERAAAHIVTDRVQALARIFYDKGAGLLENSYQLVEVLAEKLLESETMTGSEIEELLDSVHLINNI
ncbi:MAG: AAA family ATPase [Eubacterium sp.]|nr:AAA family ATPase [Eubacterium sp.]